MKYLEIPCTRCGQVKLIPPTIDDLKKARILIKCANCRKYSRYNIIHHADGTQGYTVSKWGRGSGGDLVPVRRWVYRWQAEYDSAEFREALNRLK